MSLWNRREASQVKFGDQQLNDELTDGSVECLYCVNSEDHI